MRPARLEPGWSAHAQLSYAQSPGEVASWFYDLEDCTTACSRAILAEDATVAWARVPGGGVPFALGVGINGLFPFAEGYAQVGRGRVPWGIGGRLGLPTGGWYQHQLFARADVPLGSERRLLWNPGVFLQTGHSPNRASTGHFFGVVQAVGVELPLRGFVLLPSGALAWGRAERRSYGERIGPESAVFGTVGVAITFR
ncbi:MAG TPA: hypothetical protein VGD77_06315 [Gemmatimonadaceae bacterium]